jgi:transcriptional regulator with XRE-family HTH domain
MMADKLPCPLSIHLASRTEAYRRKHGLSYRALGEMAGMSADQVICFVRGAESGATLTLRTAVKLAEAIGLKLELRGR